MLERLINALRENSPPDSANPEQIWRKQVAVAALLVEASQVDREASEAERQAVIHAIERRFAMTPEHALRLVSIAEEHFAESLDDWAFVEAVRKGYSYEERVEILRMLWQVVYADGQLGMLEDELVHRVAVQLDISEEDLDSARDTRT